MKRLISIFLIIFISISSIIVSYADLTERSQGDLNNFKHSKTFYGFSDVALSSWYYGSVGLAFSYGLLNGSNNSLFYPDNNITLAETIAIASRLHNIYYSKNYEFKETSGRWYKVYVNYYNKYILKNSLVDVGDLSNVEQVVTRDEFVKIISSAFTDEFYLVFPSINSSDSIPNGIPDVKYYDENFPIYRLYFAGVLTGSDIYGTFNPDSYIKRSEAAAMLIRTIFPSERKKFTLRDWKYKKYYNVYHDLFDWMEAASLVDFCEESVKCHFGYKGNSGYTFTNSRRNSNIVNSISNTNTVTTFYVNYTNDTYTVRSDFETISLGQSYSDYCIYTDLNSMDKVRWYTTGKMLSGHKKIAEECTMENMDIIIDCMADSIIRKCGYDLSSNEGIELTNYCYEKIKDLL